MNLVNNLINFKGIYLLLVNLNNQFYCVLQHRGSVYIFLGDMKNKFKPICCP